MTQLLRVKDAYGRWHYISGDDWAFGVAMIPLRTRDGHRKGTNRDGSFHIHRDNVVATKLGPVVPFDEFPALVQSLICEHAKVATKRKPDAPDEQTTQGVLFSGLDCLPGQTDLFPTDGEGP